MTPAALRVRPCLDGSGSPLIEFLGNHCADGYPSLLALLDRALPGFAATAEQPMPEDFVWQCRFDGGEFELSEDWAGLFILPKDDADRVMALVADTLVQTGQFRHA
jgi:hypothetical protein